MYPSFLGVHGAITLKRGAVGNALKRFAELCSRSYSLDGRALWQGISIGRKGSASKRAKALA